MKATSSKQHSLVSKRGKFPTTQTRFSSASKERKTRLSTADLPPPRKRHRRRLWGGDPTKQGPLPRPRQWGAKRRGTAICLRRVPIPFPFRRDQTLRTRRLLRFRRRALLVPSRTPKQRPRKSPPSRWKAPCLLRSLPKRPARRRHPATIRQQAERPASGAAHPHRPSRWYYLFWRPPSEPARELQLMLKYRSGANNSTSNRQKTRVCVGSAKATYFYVRQGRDRYFFAHWRQAVKMRNWHEIDFLYWNTVREDFAAFPLWYTATELWRSCEGYFTLGVSRPNRRWYTAGRAGQDLEKLLFTRNPHVFKNHYP